MIAPFDACVNGFANMGFEFKKRFRVVMKTNLSLRIKNYRLKEKFEFVLKDRAQLS